MNSTIQKEFQNIGLSNELINEMKLYYQPIFVEFIYDVLVFTDIHSMYDKYGKYEMSDSIHELMCGNMPEYTELVHNNIFVNRLYKLLMELKKNNLKIKYDTWRLNSIIELFLEKLGDLLVNDS